MTSSRLFAVPMCLVLASCAAADAPPDRNVDAAGSTIPRDPAGTFAVTTTLDVPEPAAARPLLELAHDATDGVDDPMRYVVDRLVEALPDGTPKSYVRIVAAAVAAYLDERLAEIAPRFAPGVRAIADGLARVATHVELAETLAVDSAGGAARTIRGARFDVAAAAPVLTFASHGMADVTSTTRVTLDRHGTATIDRHVIELPYGELVRLGLDRVVIPSVEPRAHDLAGALAALVDCPHVGELISEQLGVGSAELYGTACSVAMTALASELYAQLDALAAQPLVLELAGSADGFDLDGNGSLDELRSGTWTGTVSASFTGARSR